MTLWKELISIPDRVQKNDFVLKLTEGVQQKRKTVDSYVVTPELAEGFRDALGVIQNAVNGNTSIATYLHGSFGSGKSHFMAVLNLILEGFPPALKLDHIGKVVADHDWVQESDFLMVPYHFMGAESIESAILGGYVSFVQKEHPEAPLPGVYRAGRILDNADDLRAKMGDPSFFAMLNEGGSDDGGWGDLDTTWDAASYDAARHDRPGSERLELLVGDVTARVLTSFAGVATGDRYVNLDDGLAIISRHVSRLEVPNKPGKKYDGLILFLDELVLWLASHGGDVKFLNREGQKISKLIEAQDGDRPVPIISFVARQRDLREFLGDHSGNEQNSVWQQLQYWDRGLGTIILEDRNLPVIVEQRLLKPRGAPEREQINAAFLKSYNAMTPAERDTLTGTQADKDRFRTVYPFSPALIDALIALSALLHRERTALRLLLMLLVERRDHLKLGDVIPVGDLWDVISEQSEPFSEMIRNTFRAAQTLYTSRLRPMLLEEHNLLDDPDPDAKPLFRNDDRIIKTLLISTLVPNIEAFQTLTAQNLVALNFGTVKAAVRGAETSDVLQKLRRWQAVTSEIRVGEDNPGNPTISLQLTNIDIDGLLRQVQAQDNEGNRRRKIQELLFEMLNLPIPPGTEEWAPYAVNWRGASRELQVAYRNVRTTSLENFEAGEQFRLMIDYPFDEAGKSPADDSAKLNAYLERYPDGTNTIAWLPSFLSAHGRHRLGKLVCIDYFLNQFTKQVEHVAVAERPTVRNTLESQRNAFRNQLKSALSVCYGVLSDTQNSLVDYENKPQSHLVSLRPDLEIGRVSGGVQLDEMLRELAKRALRTLYPSAPRLPDDAITRGRVQKLADQLVGWIEAGETSAHVENKDLRRDFAAWAQPLELGEMGENRFAPSTTWRDRLRRELDPTSPIEVAALRDLLDPPDERTGLATSLQDLIILVFAAQEDLVFQRAGAQVQPRIGALDGARLVQRKMPSPADWEVTSTVAHAVFDVRAGHVRNARNVERLVADLKKATDQYVVVKEIGERLVTAGEALGLRRAQVVASPRYLSARRLVEIIAALKQDEADAITEIAGVATSENDLGAMKLMLERSRRINQLLSQADWFVFSRLVEREGSMGVEGLLTEARDVLTSDETVQPLSQFDALRRRAIDLLAGLAPDPPPRPPITDPAVDPPLPPPGLELERSFNAASTAELLEKLAEFLKSDATAQTLLDGGAEVRVSFVRGSK